MNEMRKVVMRIKFFSLQLFKHFIVALLLISLAIISHEWPFQAIEKDISWFTFYLAVIAATLYGGLSAGLMTTFLTPIILTFFWPFVANVSLINSFMSIIEVGFFIIICSYISYLSDMLQRTRTQLKQVKSAHESDIKSLNFMTKIVNSMPNMIGYWDKELRCRFANEAFSEWFSLHPQELIGVSFKELAGEQLYNLNKPYIHAVLAGKEQRFERTLKKKNNSIGHILAHYIPDLDDNGSVKGFSIQSSEITDLKEIEAQLKLATCVFDSTVDGILITDISGTILSVNPAFCHITGFTDDEVIGQTPRILKSNHQSQEFYIAMWERIITQGQWSGDIWNRRKSGDLFLVRMNINVVLDDQKKPLRYIAVFSDITDHWHKDEHLKHLAFYDGLTGLPNRTLLMERLSQKIINSERQQSSLAILFLDLDGFKLINDTYGHNVGDELLKVISNRLLGLVRQTDIVARLGGDEFIFVLDNPKMKDEILHVTDRILSSINSPIEVDENILNIGLSIGISMFPDNGVKSTDLIKKADKAMYISKKSAQSSVHFFMPKFDAMN